MTVNRLYEAFEAVIVVGCTTVAAAVLVVSLASVMIPTTGTVSDEFAATQVPNDAVVVHLEKMDVIGGRAG